MLNTFMLETQIDELPNYAEWLEMLNEEEQIEVIASYTLCNWGGYEIGKDADDDLFFRWNDGTHIDPWQPMETTFDEFDREWVWNPDQLALLFPLDEAIRVSPG